LAEKLPIAVDDVLHAFAHAACPECQGLGRWRTKVRCATCNGKGTTAEIAEICTVCQGRGQLASGDGPPPLICDLCDGFGVLFRECWECKQAGFTYLGDDYCRTCEGGGEIPFARKVAAAGAVPYVRHLVAKLEEYTARGSQEDLEKACRLDDLLLESLKHAHAMNPRRDGELFSDELRGQYSVARMTLGQAVREQEERSQRERKQMQVEFTEAVRRLRAKSQEIRDDIQGRFWDGLGHAWDTGS
jgi:hypothetical protein